MNSRVEVFQKELSLFQLRDHSKQNLPACSSNQRVHRGQLGRKKKEKEEEEEEEEEEETEGKE